MPKEPMPTPGPDNEPNPGPIWTPAVEEPDDPEELPDEAPNPNPDENDDPPLYASVRNATADPADGLKVADKKSGP